MVLLMSGKKSSESLSCQLSTSSRVDTFKNGAGEAALDRAGVPLPDRVGASVMFVGCVVLTFCYDPRYMSHV